MTCFEAFEAGQKGASVCTASEINIAFMLIVLLGIGFIAGILWNDRTRLK